MNIQKYHGTIHENTQKIGKTETERTNKMNTREEIRPYMFDTREKTGNISDSSWETEEQYSDIEEFMEKYKNRAK